MIGRSVLRSATVVLLMTTSCAAYSQSSITLYGIVDTGVEYYNHAAGGGNFVGVPTLTGEVPSEWGIAGTEDLGGGNKAFFKRMRSTTDAPQRGCVECCMSKRGVGLAKVRRDFPGKQRVVVVDGLCQR